MRFGVVILPELSWRDAGDRWRRAEELGFDHAWTYDHVAWRSLRDRPWFGAIPTLTAAAMVTTRLRIGPLVASPNFRHPVTFAKDVTTLDDISNGRLTVGVGAGGYGWDATVLGQRKLSRRERGERFEEFVELLDRLLREPHVSYRGRYYAAHDARMVPGCVQQPRVPMAIAATGPAGMRLAARFGDIWVTTGEGDVVRGADRNAQIAGIARQVERLEDACQRVGRASSALRRLLVTGPLVDPCVQSEPAFTEAVERYEAIGITDLVVHWPRPTEPYAGDEGVFEEVVKRCLKRRP